MHIEHIRIGERLWDIFVDGQVPDRTPCSTCDLCQKRERERQKKACTESDASATVDP